MEIRDRIKKLFGRKDELPVVETSQRYPVPAGFIDDKNTVFAAPLKRGQQSCGARLYTYEEEGVSLEKKVICDMSEAEWVDFLTRLNTAKANGYIENGKAQIPSSLCEGKRGVYATKVKRLINGAFVEDGVNIYQTDENRRNVFIRSMNEKTWRNFALLMNKTQEEEEAIRQASLSKFITLSENN